MTDGLDKVAEPTRAAMAALAAHDIDGAIAHFRAARRLAPDQPGLLLALARLLRRNGHWAEAWSAAETGLRLQPADSSLNDARLAALGDGGMTDMALTLARDWAGTTPGEPQARFRHGALLLRAGDAAGALREVAAALNLRPGWPEALVTAAEAAYRTGATEQARGWLDRAVALEPENRSTRLARATMLLSLRIWDPGLEDYEYRLRPHPALEIVRHLPLPRWHGEDITGRAILVVAEQGIGDQIRFLRHLHDLSSLAGRVIVECSVRLVPLFARSLPSAAVVPSVERQDGNRHVFDYSWLDEHAKADCYIEAGSLMLLLYRHGLSPDRPSKGGISTSSAS